MLQYSSCRGFFVCVGITYTHRARTSFLFLNDFLRAKNALIVQFMSRHLFCYASTSGECVHKLGPRNNSVSLAHGKHMFSVRGNVIMVCRVLVWDHWYLSWHSEWNPDLREFPCLLANIDWFPATGPSRRVACHANTVRK